MSKRMRLVRRLRKFNGFVSLLIENNSAPYCMAASVFKDLAGEYMKWRDYGSEEARNLLEESHRLINQWVSKFSEEDKRKLEFLKKRQG